MAPRKMACIAATLAPSRSCSPIRLATIAVVAIERPRATATTCVMITSVSPIVAVASFPSWDTKKISTRANNPSIIISSTIGTERRKIALSILPVVNSFSLPAIACLNRVKKPAIFCLMGEQK